MSTDCDEKIARLHDRIDELVRELAEKNRTILEFAAAAQESAERAKRALDAVIQMGLRPAPPAHWMDTKHDSERR